MWINLKKEIKVNQMIYIRLRVLNEMLDYCKKSDIKISALIEQMWEAFRKTYK